MSECATPAEMDEWAASVGINACKTNSVRVAAWFNKHSETLREYAAIVEAVATLETNICPFCDAWLQSHELLTSKIETDGVSEYVTSEVEHQEPEPHAPDCIYLRARRVRGYE